MPHDCAAHGHVLVDDDPLAECLVCGAVLGSDDRITMHVVRPHDELDHRDSTATIAEWGHAHLGGDAA